MIKGITTSALDDTGAVHLPGRFVSFDGNGDGLGSDGSDELVLVLLGNALEAIVDLVEGGVLGNVAGSGDSLVWVEGFEDVTLSGGVFHSNGGPAAFASVA